MNLQDAIALIKHPYISEKENARWADLGCGSGLFTFALASLLQKKSIIYAADKLPVNIQPLPNPNNINVLTKQIDFVKEPLPFGKLDGILMANSFHYVAVKTAFLEKAGGQLAEDGTFLFVEYNTDKPNHWVPYPASPQTLKNVLANAGYTNFTKLNEITSVYNSGKIYAAIAKK